MEETLKKALLFGASGFVGSALLTELLNNPVYDQVICVVRKKLNIEHPKLTTLIGDFHSLPELRHQLVADDVFLALGTTKKKTPNRNEYYIIDHDYPVLAAKFAHKNGAKSVLVVSSIGANAESNFSYIKTKGEVERDLQLLNFEHTSIFRPSMIMGNRSEKRSMEKALIGIWKVVNLFLIGKTKAYRGIKGEDIAKAMNAAAQKDFGPVRIFTWKEMNALL